MDNLLGLGRVELERYLTALGEKPYRARQLLRWIHKERVTSFELMTNLSKTLRSKLEERAEIRPPSIASRQVSRDGTAKWAIKTDNGNLIEMVLIPDRGRNTLCISSQLGCVLDCAFCATGKQGFNGNLTRSEIVGQVWLAASDLQRRGDHRGITNVVFMGMGEPLYNFDATMTVVELLKDDLAYGMAKRRVTVSTAGVVPKIYELSEHTDCALAVSLHAPDDGLRDELVPINRKYPLEELLGACRHYLSKCGEKRSITFEYALMKDVNDSLAHAKALAKLLRTVRCKINLIPFNVFPSSGFERPAETTIREFQSFMIAAGYATMLRTTRGDDIAAACGQLVGAVNDRTNRQARYLAKVRAEAVS